jgi:hypothetical protein
MSTIYSIEEAKFHGCILGIDIARSLIERGELVELNSAIRLMGGIAYGVETLVDPEKSCEGWDSVTAKLLHEAKINAVDIQKHNAIQARCGLNKMSDHISDN